MRRAPRATPNIPPSGTLGDSTWIQPLTTGAMGSPVSCVTSMEIVPFGGMFKARRRGKICELWTAPPDSLNSVANTVDRLSGRIG